MYTKKYINIFRNTLGIQTSNKKRVPQHSNNVDINELIKDYFLNFLNLISLIQGRFKWSSLTSGKHLGQYFLFNFGLSSYGRDFIVSSGFHLAQ